MDPMIRRADDSDWERIWPLFHAVVSTGDTYTFPPDIGYEDARHRWISADMRTWVAEVDGRVVGTYAMKPNQPGQGAHVANCGYMVMPDMAGHGIGRAMCAHSLEDARSAGYLAMQFNFVVSTNQRAVRLWESMGFSIVGTLPAAFRHPMFGLVDAYVMHRFL